MSAFQRLIIDRFLTTYGAPDTENVEGFFGEYKRALGGVRRDVLSKLSDRIVWQHVYPTWPTVGRCLTELRSLNAEMHGRTPEQPQERWTRKVPSADERARVAALTRDFRANMESLESEYVSTLPSQTSADSMSWASRQLGLLAAGKFCLSAFFARRAT